MHAKKTRQGFTRIELAATVATISLLALTQLPGLARQGQVSAAAVCQNNLSQLQRAWTLYAEDNDGKLVGASNSAGWGMPEWNGGGWIDFSSRSDNTDPEQNLAKSPLHSYLANHYQMWRCPTDISTATRSGETKVRVRSYSMNNWQGGSEWFASGNNWRIRRNIRDFNDPSPANSWLLMDEHPSSLNDGMLLVDMSGYGGDASAYKMVDYPASHHGGGAGVVFADGHTELKRWTDDRTVIPFIQGYFYPLNVASPDNADVDWLQERSTRRN